MGNEFTPLFVSERIHDWYHNILSRNKEKAELKKKEVKSLLDDMSPDDKIIALYSLMGYKHALTFHGEEMTKKEHEELEEISLTDNALRILLYDYNGQRAFYRNDYKTSIHWYQKAESLLHLVEDDFEKADFFKRIGILFYRINETFMAGLYLEKARKIFIKDSFYKTNELSCRIVLAGIMSERSDFNAAEKEYASILDETLFNPEMNFFCLRAFGIHYMHSGQLDKAEELFTTLLCEKEFEQANSIFRTKNKIDLANVLFQKGKHKTAYPFLKEGINELKGSIEIEYACRANVIYNLYVNYNLTNINAELRILDDKELNYEAAELCKEITGYFKRESDFETALKYMELANLYKEKGLVTIAKGE